MANMATAKPSATNLMANSATSFIYWAPGALDDCAPGTGGGAALGEPAASTWLKARSSDAFFQGKVRLKSAASSCTQRKAGREAPCGVIARSLSWRRPVRLMNVPSASAQLLAGKTTAACSAI